MWDDYDDEIRELDDARGYADPALGRLLDDARAMIEMDRDFMASNA
jgi:hypothetical protein